MPFLKKAKLHQLVSTTPKSFSTLPRSSIFSRFLKSKPLPSLPSSTLLESELKSSHTLKPYRGRSNSTNSNFTSTSTLTLCNSSLISINSCETSQSNKLNEIPPIIIDITRTETKNLKGFRPNDRESFDIMDPDYWNEEFMDVNYGLELELDGGTGKSDDGWTLYFAL